MSNTVAKPSLSLRKKWHNDVVPGKWHFHLDEMARKRGFVHVSGPYRGEINLYRLSMASGISPGRLNQLFLGKEMDHLGTKTLGRLCDALQCQPSDLLVRVPADAVIIPELARFDVPTKREPRKLPKPDTSW